MKPTCFNGHLRAIAAALACAMLVATAAHAGNAGAPASIGNAPTATTNSQNTGKATFERYCASCHAPGHGHPGTQQLGWTRGQAAAVLQERQDLTQAYVKHVVRHGLLEMPPYRPSEIDDAALDALARYLAKN